MAAVARNLEHLVAEVQSGRPCEEALPLSRRLAVALQWEKRNAHTEQMRLNLPLADGPVDVTRGFVADQPAAVFVNDRDGRGRDLLDGAALFAYHASIEWGLLAGAEDIRVFNSHWIRNGEWFSLPPISWGRVVESANVLGAITPPGLTNGRMERVATRFYKPDSIVLPVDDKLVERLDYWRAEALRSAGSDSEFDERLQRLFSQLFVLRAVEDRDLAEDLPSLASIVDQFGEVDTAGLSALFGQASSVIESGLFDRADIEGFPPSVLGGIINDLYYPSHLPVPGARYNFAWIDADILGRAYEKYLSTLLLPAPVSQFSLFVETTREVERKPVARKVSGSYYTPSFLARYITDRCMARYFRVNSSPEARLPRVVDTSCGSGTFLTAAVDSLIRRLRDRDPNRNWGRELIDRKCIIGIDNDIRAVTFARLSLWLRLAQEPEPLPLPRLEEAVVHGDSLRPGAWGRLPEEYDMVLGNPPFVATGSVQCREELSRRFRTAQGRFDYSYLFVELAVGKLGPGGVLGLVVPNRLLRNKDASYVREVLATETDVLSVVDFGSTEVFAGTSSYVCTVIARKGRTEPPAATLRFIRVFRLPERFAGAMLSEVDRRSAEVRNAYVAAYNASHPRSSDPWLLLSPVAKSARVSLEDRSEQLDAIAQVLQGIKTGANDIFVCEPVSEAIGPLVSVRDGFGEEHLVEGAILRLAAMGPDIQRYDTTRAKRVLIYPYRAGTVLSERELSMEFPNAFAYLSMYRELLASRTSIAASGARWYELVRKRDEGWLDSAKLLTRDLATEPALALDENGGVYLIGGVAVVPADTSLLLPLLGYLNSWLVKVLLGQVTPEFRSGFQKFEPQHLGRIPVMREIVEEGEVRDLLTDLARCVLDAAATGNRESQRQHEARIDRLISRVAGFRPSEMR